MLWPWYRAWRLPNCEWFHGHLQRVWHVSRERLPFRAPGSVPFWDLPMFQLLRQVFPTLPCLFLTFNLEYPSVLSNLYIYAIHMHLDLAVWLRRRLPCLKTVLGAGSNCKMDKKFLICIFAFPFLRSLTGSIRKKSSMTFIRSNKCTEI